jgi:hypothetical protein
MKKLKEILQEITQQEASKLLDKIKNKEIKFYARGDNGKVYQINNEDYLFKITTEPDELAVADVIVGRYGEFNAFIPVHYSDRSNRMYIMNKAEKLSPGDYRQVIQFYEDYKEYARNQGHETSIFEYLNTESTRKYAPRLVSFLRALEQQVKRMGIGDLEFSLDFKPDNVMQWNGNIVMIDW